jgi:hypothetical protein
MEEVKKEEDKYKKELEIKKESLKKMKKDKGREI